MSIFTHVPESKSRDRRMLEALMAEHVAKHGRRAIKVLQPRIRCRFATLRTGRY